MAFLEKMGWRYWLTGLIMGIVLPALATLLNISTVMRFGGLLLVINGGVAIAVGRLVALKARPMWLLLVLPALYLVGAYGFLPAYTRYFALVYLCVSYLAYGLTATTQTTQSESKN
ncbi:hypothetical protein LZY01_01800 [Levilactobacillus zymae]|uniref:Integral membrane protein n=1 Tax=Levilactobacillus zymae TaxID=267363 RepID=A0ABQ0WU22_9LACO|nr:hypothetical protein [Levilactobacillus zymae]KRL15536.1 hypothetical protein FD38_GL000535 [Levilactobacillus zymae DSM 19395]QFR60792.1 hypothetical protein LZ395_04285 [Levilactobacillus zymae]GEO71012.1 hypothetical protein LZY01_01800 [Levilactobacillus zymae]